MVRRPRASAGSEGGEEAGRQSPAWLRTSASLAGVVALIVLLAWGYRLMAAGGRLSLGKRSRNPGLIEIVSRANLSPRQSLSLVRIGPQLILIGATHDSVRALSVINDPELSARLAGQQAQERTDSHSAEFRRCLQGEAGVYDDGAGERQESSASGVPGVIDIRKKLSQTMRRLRGAAQWA